MLAYWTPHPAVDIHSPLPTLFPLEGGAHPPLIVCLFIPLLLAPHSHSLSLLVPFHFSLSHLFFYFPFFSLSLPSPPSSFILSLPSVSNRAAGRRGNYSSSFFTFFLFSPLTGFRPAPALSLSIGSFTVFPFSRKKVKDRKGGGERA